MPKAPSNRRLLLAGLVGFLLAVVLGVIGWSLIDSDQGEMAALVPPSTTLATSTTVAATTTTATPSTTTTTSTTVPTTTTSTTTTTTLPPGKDIQIICRDAWGAAPPTGEFTFHEIERITVHHTGALIEDNTLSPGFTRRHQRYHQGDELGWPDIAYHFLIDSHGYVYEGRRWDAVGDTRTTYDPTGHLLIAVKGNFEEQVITDVQYERLVEMLAWGSGKFDIDPLEITGHRDWAATACPGASLYPLLADGTIATDVQTLLDEGGTRLVEFCGPEATQLVADIESGDA